MGNHSEVPTFIMGDLNSLSPGDDAFYRASGLAAHVDALRFNRDGADGGADKRMQQIGKRLHRKFMLRDRTSKDPSRIDYRPVQSLLHRGWMDLLAAAGDACVSPSLALSPSPTPSPSPAPTTRRWRRAFKRSPPCSSPR